ncbi:MAG: hypothetical protein IAI48_00575 [Candidatus Eremiobacteraeota bacterium]|nr:hypothetical protein [Candidatus Eremiobacteraeota bacterium]
MMTVRQARSTRDQILEAAARIVATPGGPTFDDLSAVALALAEAQVKVVAILASTHASYLPAPNGVTP